MDAVAKTVVKEVEVAPYWNVNGDIAPGISSISSGRSSSILECKLSNLIFISVTSE